MEPRDRGAQALTSDEARTRWRLRLVAGCALLLGLAFVQSPGFMVADTKFDLVVDPGGFLGRALHLWDSAGAFGQLQNQAYGYLWPMGPFFAVFALIDLPGWVVQRLWMALVMCVGFVGTARAARVMGVRSDVACLVAAFAFATSPRMLSTLGPISIEAWPSAVAPWVLWALVKGSQAGSSPRRMALWAGLGVAMVGGVNAAATFAVIPVGAVWLLTRTPGPRRRALMLWWPVFTLMGTLWWLVPLFLMGAYSPPFLDYIETASVTTIPTTLFDALRGTSDWVPYIEPSWQGGYETITRAYLPLNSGVVLMMGLVGMLWSGNPHRRFLVLSLLLGLFMVTMGHLGSVQGWLAHDLNGALDAALAPLRNVHKFDPVIRLPMVLGLAWLIQAVLATSGTNSVEVGQRTLRWPSHLPITVLALVAVLGAALPLLGGRVAPTRGVVETPPYWDQAVTWLDEEADDGSVALLAPGSSFADYLWGAPRDEPVQYLEADRWAVRNAVPLTPGGNIRMLDAFEARLNQGHGSPGLASYLRRAGVGHIVVRNDLRPTGDVPNPLLVHQALADSPGIRRVQSFGPTVGGEANLSTEDGRILVDGGWQSEFPAIEIYEVIGEVRGASTATDLPVVFGGPEDLLDLTDYGVLSRQPTQLAVDADDERVPQTYLLTDGLLDRERMFGRVHDGYSAVREPGATGTSGNPVADYLLDDEPTDRTHAALDGIADVSASSSMADANAVGGSVPGQLPFAAIDGDPDSQWASNPGAEGVARWEVDLGRSVFVDQVSLVLGDAADERKTVRVVTDAGASDPIDLDRGIPATVPIGELTTSLRVEDVSATGGQLALAEVTVPGVQATRRLVLPEIPEAWGSPATILLRALTDARTGCVIVDGDVRCVSPRVVPSEEPNGFTREFTLPRATSVQTALRARPRPGVELESLIQRDQPLNVRGSTTGVPDVRASGLAAVDGDPGTAWTARVDDLRPALSLNWLGKRRIDELQIRVDPDAPVRAPTTIEMRWPGGKRVVDLDEDGHADFKPIRTDQLTLQVTEAENAGSVDESGIGYRLPIGISELRLPGLPLAPIAVPDETIDYGCGSGPTVTTGGQRVRSRVVASPRELYSMQEVTIRPCGAGSVDLTVGRNVVQVAASEVTTPAALVLRSGTATVANETRWAPTEEDRPGSVTIDPEAGGDTVVLHQNTNPGWEATQGGRTLDPVIVDGWQQGWRTDGSTKPVRAEFGPDGTYRLGLLVGGLFLLGLFGLALVPARRWPGASLSPLAERELGPLVLWPVGAVALGLLAGWPGVACGVIGALLGLLVRRVGDAGAWLVGLLPFVAAGAYFVRPWGSADGWAGTWSWPHYLVVVSLAAVVVVASGRFERPRFLSRMLGNSMNR